MPTQPDPVALGVLGGVFTLLAGFCTWAAGHFLYMRLASEQYKKLRGWTEYKAAFWGDLLILPIVNGLLIWMLAQLPFDPIGTYWLPILAAVSITIFVHLEQALLGHVNWTMPRPWRWNSFGFYHGLFMAVNLILVFFFLEQAIPFWSELTTAPLLFGFIGVLLGWFLMLVLFIADRRVVAR